ncbi:MAG: Bug family tripartite tricarboxylate transporter substrate binding protein, partial [Burkholderiales bacterium]
MVVASLILSLAQAQSYPIKPVRLVVPASPGSSPDALNRTLAQALSARLGQAFIVENVPGAGGNIAAANVVKAAPDGYTLLYQNSGIVINPSLYKQVPYDPIKHFQPVILVAWAVSFLAVYPTIEGVNSVRELVAFSKARPGKLNYASPGFGTPQHVRMEIFKALTGADFTHVPFKTPPEMVRGMLSGDVAATFSSANDVIPQARAGKLKLLAVLGEQRWPLMPNVPTMAEAGYADYKADIWQGYFVPAATPGEIVRKINAEFAAVLNAPTMKELLVKQGIA